MKILIVLLLLPFSVLGQTAPKGATKIIVSNELSAKENFAHAVSVLLDNGYFFDSRDSTIGYIKTQAKSGKSGTYFLNVRATDKKIEVSGMVKSGIELNLGGASVADDFSIISNTGMKGSILRKSFEEMSKAITRMKGSISYN